MDNNAARIRENQRRSRAQRKEYVRTVESRLRQCEMQGVEASSEIQAAAKRVIEENYKLRELLNQYGISNDVIEGHLQLPSHSGPTRIFKCTSNTVPILESILSTRKNCSQERSSIPEMPKLTPDGAPNESTGNIMEFKSPAVLVPHTLISPEAQIQMSTALITQPDLTPTLQSKHKTILESNVSSCALAIAMITTMAGGDPQAVSAELGCHSGIDCDLDNQLIFNVMDRYSNRNIM